MSTFTLRQADIIRVLQGENTKYVIFAINLLLVVWIASQLATLTWGVLSPQQADEPALMAPVPVPDKVDKDRQLVQQLPGWHLMGVVQAEAVTVKTVVPVDAPETRLKLTLRGALASEDPQHARAIIADEKGEDEKYSIGDELPGNAELSEIYPDRVILKRNGRYETLRLPQDANSSSTVSTAAKPSFFASGRPILTPRERMANVRRQIRTNPKSVFGMVRTRAETNANGELIGYAVSPGNNEEMFTELGLIDGDVVTRVNDMDLSDPANAAKALQVLKSGKPVSLVLLRDGQEQSLQLDGQ